MDIAPLSQNVADAVVDGYAAAPITLVLERSGGRDGVAARRSVRFVRLSEFARSAPPRYGLMFKRAAAREPFLVTRVVAGSAAARAGLRPGDTILSLNGAMAATMTPSQLQEELWKEEWALRVRVGADKATRLIGLKGVRASWASPPAKHKKNK